MRIEATLVLALAGCGGPPNLQVGELKYHYSVQGLQISSELPLNQDNINADIDSCRAVLAKRNIVSPADFNWVSDHMPVVVVSAYDWGYDTKYTGWYDVNRGITLDYEGPALCHELLHAWDSTHLAVGTSWHQGWKENGYFAAAEEYQDSYLPFSDGKLYE